MSDGSKGGNPHFPSLQHYLSLIIRLFSVKSRTLVVGVYSSAYVLSIYSTAPTDWAASFGELWGSYPYAEDTFSPAFRTVFGFMFSL